ncbi:MAG: hypothetical protein K0R38_675 [Polyangiaceae bacterium]|jgi:hypothetical protein|nr:hypothetical protein [Polyangiaceae bacterium]
MRLHRLSGFGFGALALAFAAGCSGGQTGDLSGKGDRTNQKVGHETSGGCDEQRTEVDFDEPTEAGSANELLSYAERTFDAPLAWKGGDSGQFWSAGPESGTGALHIGVARGAKAYRITYTEPQNGSGQELASAVLCPPPRLGVEATVSVVTDGGALAESFETVLRSETPGVAMLNVPFAVSELEGELSVDSSNPNATLVQLGLDAILTSAGTTGSISGMEQVTSGSGPNGTVSARPAVLAVWPGVESCAAGVGLEVALDDDVLGATGESHLAAVTPAAPVSVDWLDGSTTTLNVDIASTGPGCFRVSNSPVPGDAGPVTQYPVMVTLQSADGRLNGTYAGQVEARGGEGSQSVVAAVMLNLPAADVAESGFSDVSLPSGTETVSLQFESKASSGFVRLVAVSASPCAMQSSGSGSGSGTPGCAGANQLQVEGASWSD